jgi:ATP synthase protein I
MTTPRPNRTETNKPPAGRQDPLGTLDKDIEAFEAGRRKTRSTVAAGMAGGDGYRVLGQLLSGLLGGIGLGWLLDQVAHTTPWGLVGGLVIGTGLSIFSTVRMASRFGAGTNSQPPPDVPAVVDDDDDA